MISVLIIKEDPRLSVLCEDSEKVAVCKQEDCFHQESNLPTP